MNKHITLLVVDPASILFNNLVSDTALSAFNLLHIKDRNTVLEKIQTKHVDIIVLDYEKSREQEIDFITNLRRSKNLALLLILSSVATSTECVKCLSAGADDFMLKPYVYSELVARISSLARNVVNAKKLTRSKPKGKLQLDSSSLNASYKSCDLNLTKTEFRVLNAIARRKGRAVSHEALIEELYGCELDLTRNSIEVHVSAIRRKLSAAGAPTTVHTRRGFGYFIG